MVEIDGWRKDALHGLVADRVRRAMEEATRTERYRLAVDFRFLGAPATKDDVAHRVNVTRGAGRMNVNMTTGALKRGVAALGAYLRAERSTDGQWGLTACAMAAYAEVETATHPGERPSSRALYGRDPLACLAVEVLAYAGFPHDWEGGRFVPLVKGCAPPVAPRREPRRRLAEVRDQDVGYAEDDGMDGSSLPFGMR